MIALLESAATSESAAETESTSSSRSSDALLWVGLAGILLLAAAAWPMQERSLPAWTIAALSAGLAAWALVAWKAAGPPEDLAPIAPESVSAGRVVSGVALSLALAAISWMRTKNQQFDPVGVAAWSGAIAVWLWSWRPASAAVEPVRGPRPWVSRRGLGIGAALLLILAIGAFFRFSRLSEIPPHPGSDHAEDLLNLVDLQEGQRPVFFPRNTGQAPLPFYFEYLLHRVLGLPINYLTLKISTAAIGMLAILAMYRLGKELGGARLGLVAAAIMAFSKWPTLGARRGLTFVWAVFPAALALAALLRFMRRGDRGSALSAGFWIGLGQFGYNAFKIVPALVPIAVGLSLFDPRWRGRRAKILGGALLITATSLLVFLPLLQYMLQDPGDFWYRAMTRAGSRERPLPGPAPVIFASNLKAMMLAFHWRGDQAWINTVSEEPFLDPVTGAFLLAGVLAALACALRGSRRWALVLLSLPVLTLASTLALAFPVENPGINRAAVAMPSVFVLAALPAAWMLGEARRRSALQRVAVVAALLLFGAAAVRENYQSYFVRFRWEQTKLLEPVLDLVRVMREHRQKGVPFDNVYLLNSANWIDGRAVSFEIGDPRWFDPHDVAPGAPVPFLRDRPLLFFVHQSDADRRAQLRQAFPDGQERFVTQPFKDRSYYTYYVPR